MKKLIQALTILLISLFIGNACNKPSTIGSDLLPEEDFVNLSYTDTISLRTSTMIGDSVQTYSPTLSQQLSTYLCGRLNDPICGESSANLSAQFGIISKPTLNEPQIDSVVLLLAYAGDLYSNESYYSTQMFEVSEKVSQTAIPAVPKVDQNVSLKVPYIDTLGQLQYRDSLFLPHLRIPLEPEFGDSLLNFIADSTFLGLADEFTQFFKGLTVQPNEDNNAMLRFNLSSVYSEIRLYYSEPDPDIIAMRPKEIVLPIRSTSVKTSGFSHDYATGEVENFLDTSVSNSQDFTFIQSMEGLMTKIEFPGLADFEDIAVNQAELIFTVVRDSDTDIYPLPQRIAAFQRNTEDNLNGIEDVINAINGNPNLFGGNQTFTVENDEKVVQYRMFITSFLQGIIDGRHPENAMYLLPFDRGEQATRAVLGGSNHNHYPAQLRLTYTRLE